MINKEISLQDLVLYKKNLEKELPEGECLPDDVIEMSELATNLLEGRIDQACRFDVALEAHENALKLQLENVAHLREMARNLMKKAVEASGQTRLDGQAYSLRVQTNGGAPSTIFDDESKIPMNLKKVTLTHTFSYTDDSLLYWVRATVGRLVEYKKDLTEKEKTANPFYLLDITKDEREKLEKSFRIEPSKSAIAEAMKQAAVPGCHQERGTHLRIIPGKAKTLT